MRILLVKKELLLHLLRPKKTLNVILTIQNPLLNWTMMFVVISWLGLSTKKTLSLHCFDTFFLIGRVRNQLHWLNFVLQIELFRKGRSCEVIDTYMAFWGIAKIEFPYLIHSNLLMMLFYCKGFFFLLFRIRKILCTNNCGILYFILKALFLLYFCT